MKTALSLPAFSDDRWVRSLSYYAAFIGVGLTTSMIGPVLPQLAQMTGTELSQISIVFAAGPLGYMVAAARGGRLYDRMTGHLVMAISLFLMAIATIAVPLMPVLWLMVAALFLIGVGQSLVDIGGNTLLMWTYGAAVGPYMNALHFFFGIGTLLAPVIIGQVASFGGSITWAFVILAVPILPVAVWLIRLPSPPVQAADSAIGAEEIPYGLVSLIALFYFLYVGAELSYGGWIFTYVITKDLMGEAAAYYLTAVFWGAFTLGRLLSIPLGVRFSPRQLLNWALLAGILSIAVILAWPNSLASLWLGTVGIGLAMAPIFPAMLAFLERRMVISGQITGWFFLGGSLGAMAIPWLIGQRFEATGPAVAMVIIAIAWLAQVAVYLGLLIRFRNRGEKQS